MVRDHTKRPHPGLDFPMLESDSGLLGWERSDYTAHVCIPCRGCGEHRVFGEQELYNLATCTIARVHRAPTGEDLPSWMCPRCNARHGAEAAARQGQLQ